MIYLVVTDESDEFLGYKNKILIDKIKCISWGDILESKIPNDFKRCSCGKVAIDSGHEYLKRIGNEEDYIKLCEMNE